MAPQKKPEEIMAASDTLVVKSSDLLFMRDNFISGLSHLESGVHELKRAYITQFNTLLPEGHPGRLTLPFFPPTAVAMAPGPAGVPAPIPGNAQIAAGEANVKRKRKPHDRNAPKRALTSYFLYMQHKKPELKNEHPEWTAQQVSEESEKLWATISDTERADYEYMYQVDLARYYKQKECYERDGVYPEVDADEAKRLYQEHLKKGVPFKGRKGKKVERPVNIPPQDRVASQPPTSEEEQEMDDEPEEEEEEEEAEEQVPPPKSKRQKTAPVPTELPKSPEKKAKKGGRKSEILAAEPEVTASPQKSKKSKKAGRKGQGNEE